ncbi:MAG TPA: hypothetical protein VKV73_04520 [Chloroflexota bacterium]|nr:hypothetical protein [Chloroflexota bacterium]
MRTDQAEGSRRSLLGRLAGVAGVAIVVGSFLPVVGAAGAGPFYSGFSAEQIVTWVRENAVALNVHGFAIGLSQTVFALFIVLLVAAAAGRGLLAVIAYLSAGAAVATDWATSGVYFALADAGQHSGSDAAVIGLFSLAKMMAASDGVEIGLAVAAVSVLAMRSRALPMPLAWLGLAAAAYLIFEAPVQIAISQSAVGRLAGIGGVLGLLWILAVAIVLLIKPVWGPSPMQSAATATS